MHVFLFFRLIPGDLQGASVGQRPIDLGEHDAVVVQ
jgi:hypothetical protein